MSNFVSYLLIRLIISIVVFLLLREVVCWYYKINESISLQTKMNELLETLLMNNSDLNEQNINLDNPTIDPLNFTSNEIIGDTKKIENLEIAQYDFPNKMNWKKANIVCSSLGNGWRLPTKYEFHLLNRNKNKIGGFVNECYWSSTEYDREYAWNQNFSNGDQNTDLYESNHNVRAVRSK